MNLNDFHLPSLLPGSEKSEIGTIKDYLRGLTDALQYILVHLSLEENVLETDMKALRASIAAAEASPGCVRYDTDQTGETDAADKARAQANIGVAGHLTNSDIHVTAAKKTSWDNHAANSDIHVTAAKKTSWDNHAANNDIHVTAAQKAAWSSIGLSIEQILNTTSITTSVTSFNSAWDNYDLLLFVPGIGGHASPGTVVPKSFFEQTIDTLTVTLPCFLASGAFAFTIRARQNGSGKMQVYLNASTTQTARLRVWGVKL